MRSGLIGRKLGMTQLFNEQGAQVAVTVVQVKPCVVVSQKTAEKDGYNAVQLGTDPIAANKLSKPLRVFFEKKQAEPMRYLREFRVTAENMLDTGASLAADHFSKGQLVDVAGITVGKGFAGGMKRHGFGGLPASHGVSVSHRSHGSTGNRQDPGKVFKNKKMAGHMGVDRVTTLNLVVEDVDTEHGLVFIRGSVPGPKNGIVYVRDAIKIAR
jgi:large subunit ribosomal protein L3